MPVFDLHEVRDFTADLDQQMIKCDNGEGTQCADLDAKLEHYSHLCSNYINAVRAWGRDVFSGKVALNPEVEQLWQEMGSTLRDRATHVAIKAEAAEIPCYELTGKVVLKSMLWDLERLLEKWVTPKLAITPCARLGLPADAETAAKIRSLLESLPPLPSNLKY